MLAYVDNFKKCPDLSFPSLDSALVDRVMGKINQMKQGVEAAAEEEIDASKILSFDVPSSEIESDSEDEGDKDVAAREEGDDKNYEDDHNDDNDDDNDDNVDGGQGSGGDGGDHNEASDKGRG